MSFANDLRQRAVDFVADRFNPAYDYWSIQYHKRWRDLDHYYHVELPDRLAAELEADDRSNLVPPDAHLLTNDFRAQIVLPFARSGKIAKIRGRGPMDVANELFAQTLFDWNLDLTNYWEQMDLDAFSIATKGHAVGQWVLEPMYDRMVVGGRLVELPMFDGAPMPTYQSLDPYKFYPDPAAKSLKWPDCRFVCYQTYLTRQILLSYRAKYPESWGFDVDELDKIFGRVTRDDAQKWRQRFGQYDERPVSLNEPIPVTFYLGDWVDRDDSHDYKQAIIAVAGDQEPCLVQFSLPDSALPLVEYFSMQQINPEPGRLLSMGKLAVVEDLFLELFVKKNQQIEQADIGTYGVNFIQRGHGAPTTHRVGPYTYVELDNPLQLQTFQARPAVELYRAHADVEQGLRNAYGSNYSLGLDSADPESATGANILVEQQTKLQIQAVRHMWNSGLKRQCELRMKFLQLYMPDEVYVRLSEDQTKPLQRITRDHIMGMFDMKMAIGTQDFEPDVVRHSRAERMMGMFRGDPNVNQTWLYKKYFQAFDQADTEALVLTQDEQELAARKESALILQYGIRIPVADGEDQVTHARVHLQDLISAIDAAKTDGSIRAENIQSLMEHYEEHIMKLQAIAGTQPGNPTVLQAGAGKLALPNPKEGGPVNRIQATASSAQKIAQGRGVFGQ